MVILTSFAGTFVCLDLPVNWEWPLESISKFFMVNKCHHHMEGVPGDIWFTKWDE